MAVEAIKDVKETGLRAKLERAAQESRSPVHPVFGWTDLKKTVSELFKKSESSADSKRAEAACGKR
jgi:hypothetical protein